MHKFPPIDNITLIVFNNFKSANTCVVLKVNGEENQSSPLWSGERGRDVNQIQQEKFPLLLTKRSQVTENLCFESGNVKCTLNKFENRYIRCVGKFSRYYRLLLEKFFCWQLFPMYLHLPTLSNALTFFSGEILGAVLSCTMSFSLVYYLLEHHPN